jgi:hypothetical protein
VLVVSSSEQTPSLIRRRITTALAVADVPSHPPRPNQDTAVTIRSAPTRQHDGLVPWVLTACGVVAGPALFGVAQATVDVTLASVVIGLTALVIAFALRHRKHHVDVAAPAGRRIATLGWSPP